jgi:hypothetical protein
MVTVKLSSKMLRLDHEKVIKSVKQAERRRLMYAGGMVRKISRNSIRPAGKSGITSKPGEPPRTHTKDLKKILFGYDTAISAVVVGPVRFNRKGPGGKVVPGLLEHGGRVRVRDMLVARGGGLGRGTGGRFVGLDKDFERVTGTLTYAPRPFMGPALEAAQSDIPELFKNSVSP